MKLSNTGSVGQVLEYSLPGTVPIDFPVDFSFILIEKTDIL